MSVCLGDNASRHLRVSFFFSVSNVWVPFRLSLNQFFHNSSWRFRGYHPRNVYNFPFASLWKPPTHSARRRTNARVWRVGSLPDAVCNTCVPMSFFSLGRLPLFHFIILDKSTINMCSSRSCLCFGKLFMVDMSVYVFLYEEAAPRSHSSAGTCFGGSVPA